MNVIALGNFEEGGNKVVLGGGVGLDDVSSLSTHVQVVDLGVAGDAIGTGANAEHVATILEHTTGLLSIDGDGEVHALVLKKYLSTVRED